MILSFRATIITSFVLLVHIIFIAAILDGSKAFSVTKLGKSDRAIFTKSIGKFFEDLAKKYVFQI